MNNSHKITYQNAGKPVLVRLCEVFTSAPLYYCLYVFDLVYIFLIVSPRKIGDNSAKRAPRKTKSKTAYPTRLKALRPVATRRPRAGCARSSSWPPEGAEIPPATTPASSTSTVLSIIEGKTGHYGKQISGLCIPLTEMPQKDKTTK